MWRRSAAASSGFAHRPERYRRSRECPGAGRLSRLGRALRAAVRGRIIWAGSSLAALALLALALAWRGRGGPQTRADAASELRVGDGRGGIGKRRIGNFSMPTYVTHAPGAPRHLYVVETGGRVRVVHRGNPRRRPFLDIHGRVSAGGERGLLSIAFDPHYRRNRLFYAYYTNPAGNLADRRVPRPLQQGRQGALAPQGDRNPRTPARRTTTAASSSSGRTAGSTRPPGTGAAQAIRARTRRTGAACSASCFASTPTSTAHGPTGRRAATPTSAGRARTRSSPTACVTRTGSRSTATGS